MIVSYMYIAGKKPNSYIDCATAAQRMEFYTN